MRPQLGRAIAPDAGSAEPKDARQLELLRP